MKLVKRFFIVLLFISFLPLTAVYSLENDPKFIDVQLVGMPAPIDPNDEKNSKPTTDPDEEKEAPANTPAI